jgi:hypothetical protein
MIKLRKVGEEAIKKLPRNIRLLKLGDQCTFVRFTISGRIIPLPEDEQIKLRKEYDI